MSAAPALALLAATAVAGVSAAADGALLSADADADDDPRVRRAVADREQLHRTLGFSRVVGQLLAGASAALVVGLPHLGSGERPGAADVVLVVGLALLVTLVAEWAARAVGDALGTRALVPLLPAARALHFVFRPACAAAGRLDHALQRALPNQAPDEEEREAAEEQFREVIAAEADVSSEQERLMQRVFAMGDTAVRDIMVPRVDVLALERDAPWNEVVDRVRSAEHMRLPVYDGTVDDVVGVLYAKDLLPTLVEEGEEPEAGWASLVRPALFIPGTKTIRDQLRDFKATGNHLAIVADEYGGTAGLVTIEDILEEIVGDIRDEHDVEEPELEREGDRCFWAAGRLAIDALAEALDHQFEAEGVTTVGGLVYTHLGRVPRPGEQFVLDGFRVVVERVVRRRIERVYFERLGAPEPGGRRVSLASLLLVLLALVACLTAAGTAVRSVSRIWLRHWVERRLGGSPLATSYLERPQRLLMAASAGVALTVFGAGAALGADHLARGRPAWVFAARLIAAAVAVLLLGQTVPRALARRWSAALIPVLIPLLRGMDVLLAPVRALANLLVRPVARRAVDPAQETRDNIEELLREGELEGVGERDEIAIITGVVQFGDKAASDVMTPREQVFALDVDTPAAELARRVAQAGYSRIPLYRGTLDDVVGMVHAFDVLKAEGGPVAPRPVAVTPASRPCHDLLFYMLRARRHLAVVRDDAGRTAGVVTLEDLLEELVGEIRDEHDEPLPEPAGHAALVAADGPSPVPQRAVAARLPFDPGPRADDAPPA